jgi:hypothetical protein
MRNWNSEELSIVLKISQLADGTVWITEQAVYLETNSWVILSNTVDLENKIGIWSKKVTWDHAKLILPTAEHL